MAVRTNGDDQVVVIGADGTATPLPLDATANVVHRGRPRHAGAADRVWRARLRGAVADRRRRPWERGARRRADPHRGAKSGCRSPARSPSTARTVRFTRSTTPRRTPMRTVRRMSSPPYVVFVHGGPTSHVGRRGIRQDRILHEPWNRRARRQLRRVDRIRPRSTASACSDSGASSTSTTSSPPLADSPSRAVPTRPGSRSRVDRRVAGRCCAP